MKYSVPTLFVQLSFAALISLTVFNNHSHAQCNQNNFAVTELYFLDANGNPINNSSGNSGTKVAGKIYAIFSGSSNNAFFPLRFSFKEDVNGSTATNVSSYCVQKITNSSTNRIPKDRLVFLFDYEMEWGSTVNFKDLYLQWRTNEGQTSCSINNNNAQCFSSPQGLRVNTSFSIMPVIWQDLKVNYFPDQNEAKLQWFTVKEWNSSHFEIQRSMNGITNFESIGVINSAGFSEELLQYQFVDNSLPPIEGRYYYRIIQEDLDGKKEFSNVLSIHKKQTKPLEQEWQFFPNPSSGENLQMRYLGNQVPEEIQIRLIGMNYQKSFALIPQHNTIDLSAMLKDLPIGVMILEVISNTGNEKHKIIKK